MADKELKPCPFCGMNLIVAKGIDELYEHPPSAYCPATGHEVWVDDPKDIDAWNRRAGDTDAG